MKIISFNINGLRAHLNQIEKIIELYNPTFIGLQETKVSNDIFPNYIFTKYGYYTYNNGYKNYNGVTIASKIKANNFYFRFNNKFDFNNRIVICEFTINKKKIILINIYVPQGDNKFNYEKFNYKKTFIKELINFVKNLLLDNQLHILVFGDINISPYDIDIGINNKRKIKWIKLKKCSFLKEEVILFNEIINCGLIDIFRIMNPKNKKFTWFDYRYNSFIKNEGLRLDMFFSNKKLFDLCLSSDIKYNIRSMKIYSDHAPLLSEFNF